MAAILNFPGHFLADDDSGSRPDPWQDDVLERAPGYTDIAGKFAGRSFDGGLYRLHDASSGPMGLGLAQDAFPAFAARAVPFGFDWLGRQFALDVARSTNGQSLVVLMEPGTGEVLELPFTFRAFHEQLDELREPALAESFFKKWKSTGGRPPLAFAACVGYKVPLFLGGVDDTANLEVTDFEVYWTLSAQMIAATRATPPGTSIRQVTSEE